MAGIKFEDFIISKASYIRNKDFNQQTEELNAQTSFECDINMSDSHAIVKLISQTGDLELEDSLFQVNVEIEGFFEYVESENEGIDFKQYLTNNAIAILFPFLRSTISELTAKSNEYPFLNLPTINVAKMLEVEEKINITHYTETETDDMS